jgi:hypothetical protein
LIAIALVLVVAPAAARAAEPPPFPRAEDAGLERYKARGPFAVSVRDDRELRIAPGESVPADLYVSAAGERLPLAVFVHGHESTKRAHALQAAHLASWGLHSLVLQLPAYGPWAANGRLLTRIVRAIQRNPQLVEARFDATKIVLVGYSFGALAVAVALGDGAPAAGAVLLDPAAIANDVPLLRRVAKPIMIIGADDELLTTRNRDYFYEYVRGPVAEVSIRDAEHEDAQYPSDFGTQAADDVAGAESPQMTFVSALTAAALSLTMSGSFEQAWSAFGPALKSGKLFNAKKK